MQSTDEAHRTGPKRQHYDSNMELKLNRLRSLWLETVTVHVKPFTIRFFRGNDRKVTVEALRAGAAPITFTLPIKTKKQREAVVARMVELFALRTRIADGVFALLSSF